MYLKFKNHLYSLQDCISVECEGVSIHFTFANQPACSISFVHPEIAEAAFDAIAKHIAQHVSLILDEFQAEGNDALDVHFE